MSIVRFHELDILEVDTRDQDVIELQCFSYHGNSRADSVVFSNLWLHLRKWHLLFTKTSQHRHRQSRAVQSFSIQQPMPRDSTRILHQVCRSPPSRSRYCHLCNECVATFDRNRLFLYKKCANSDVMSILLSIHIALAGK